MKKEFILFVLFIAAILFLTESCKLATDPEENNDIGTQKGVFKISGVVVDSSSGDPIETAIVKLIGDDTTYVIRTDADGVYSTEISIGKAIDFYVTASKEGYYARTVQITATADDNKQMPPFQLRPFFNLPDKSVDPATINLFSQSLESIGVKESGAIEAAEIVFEVRDSSGIPLDLDHKSTVYFRLGNSPGGGEYLFPDSAKTNGKGLATVAVNSGTKSGVVQVVAEINQNGIIIRSKPVFIAIHGGLPDQKHFSIELEECNYPSLVLASPQNGFYVRVIVGDKYSNPVVPGTSVYFETTAGVIQGSVLTDELGRGEVRYFPSNPRPKPEDNGFATITAKTANENLDSIKISTSYIYTGNIYNFSVTPDNFDIPDGGSKTFYYTVSDINNNPLSFGSHYTVSVEGENIDLFGDTDITIGTCYDNVNYTFTLKDKISGDDNLRDVRITVEAFHPLLNTRISKIITGEAR